MKRLSTLLLTTLFLLSGCSFDPEAARLSNDHQNGGWDIGDDEDTIENPDTTPAPAPDAQTPRPGDPTPGEQDPGEQDPGEQDPDPPDAGEHDADPPDTDEQDSGEQDPDPPPNPIIECDGQEIDSSSDPEHCGGCDNACDPQFGICHNSQCVCPTGHSACGEENRCEDIKNDARHCGECGVECGPGEFCSDGQCTCREGLTKCGDSCVDTRNDPEHCGSCENSCGTKACGSGTCHDRCYFQGLTCQPDGATGKTCTSTPTSSVLHCNPGYPNGNCGLQCNADQVCVKFRGCRDFRPARGCFTCPCNDCAADEDCRTDIRGIDGAFCIRK